MTRKTYHIERWSPHPTKGWSVVPLVRRHFKTSLRIAFRAQWSGARFIELEAGDES